MTFKNYKSLKIGDWNFKKLIRASDGLVLFEKYSKPYKYQLKYIQNTNTQFINTGIAAGDDEMRVEYDIQIEPGSSRRLHGITPLASDYWGVTDTNYYQIGNYKSNKTKVGNRDIVKWIYSNKINRLYVNDILQFSAQPMTATGISKNLYLWAIGEARYNKLTNTKIYGVKIYRNNILEADIIPVVDLDDTICMYDKVSNRLLYNAGTGNFIAGVADNPYVTDGLVNMFDALLVPNWQDVIGNAIMTDTSATEGYTNLGYQITGVNWPELYKGAFTIQIAFNQTAINGNWHSLLENKGTRSGYYSLDVSIAWTKTLSTYAIRCRAKQASASRLPITGFEKGTPFYGTITISAPASGRGTYTFNDNQPVYYAITGSADYAPASDVITSSLGQNKNKTRVYGIRIYNRALTEDEIAANYAIDKQRFNI